MAASWKYFASRILTLIFVLFLVVFLLSYSFIYMVHEKGDIRARELMIQESIQKKDKLNNMTIEEKADWIDQRKSRYEEMLDIEGSVAENSLDKTMDIFSGDFGRSRLFRSSGNERRAEVLAIISSYFPRTIVLFTTAAVIYVVLGLFVGLKAAQVAGSKLDRFLSVFSITASSMPMWWLAMIAVIIFGYALEWFPTSAAPFPQSSGLEYYAGILYRMVMPLGVIVFNLFGARAWITRNIVVDILEDDYIMAARAKGVPEKKVLLGHTLKTAMPPVITSSIMAFMMSISQAIITEAIFGWPGIGQLFYNSLRPQDYGGPDVDMVVGLIFTLAFIYVGAYLVADVIYGILDPRVKVGAEDTFNNF